MNKTIIWIKQNRVRSGILAVLLISFVWYSPFFKATDPTNPLFVESLFRLRDYGSRTGARELRDIVLPNLFPKGTSKEYVDKMLVSYGGAHIIDHSMYFKGGYVYRYKPLYLLITPDGFSIRVYYNDDNKVDAIHFAGKMVVGEGYKTTIIPKKKTTVEENAAEVDGN